MSKTITIKADNEEALLDKIIEIKKKDSSIAIGPIEPILGPKFKTFGYKCVLFDSETQDRVNQAIEDELKECDNDAFAKFKEQDFENIEKVHDWKNYVSESMVKNWEFLTEREKKIIFILTQPWAGNEEWD